MKITWYGHCCFLFEIDNQKILFDPFDTFNNIDLGIISSDITLISSTWHDHGHIGASPKAYIYSYPGRYKHEDIIITGIESQEARGTPNTIFNVKYQNFSITNFADFGDLCSLEKISQKNKDILQTTNIALMRFNETDDPGIFHYDLALRACDPAIIIPHHYFPLGFIKKHLQGTKQQSYSKKLPKVEHMINALSNYNRLNIKGHDHSIKKSDFDKREILMFSDIHPQVKYVMQ